MLAIKNGTYKLDYARRKKDPAFMERKRMMDQIYREKKKNGVSTSRKTNDNALVNQDWKEYAKTWRSQDGYKQYKGLKDADNYAKARDQIFNHYCQGNPRCMSCGVQDKRVLAIDHINNDGAKHRSEIGQLTPVWWIIKNNFPPGFQILCCNCNWIKELERRAVKFDLDNLE